MSSSDEDKKTVEIERWEPNYEKGKHFAQIIISSRNSGKSYLCRYLLLYHLRDKFDVFVIFVNNKEELDKYTEILPTDLAFMNYNPAILQELSDHNAKREAEGKRKLNILALLDDTIGNRIKSDDSLLQIFSNGRHRGISCIFITQSYSLANSNWRTNSDIVVLLKQNSSLARKSIKETFLEGAFYVPDGVNEKRLYNDIMRKHMSKVGDCLVIDYRGASIDNLHHYRAPEGLE